jgi:sortase A
MPRVSSGFERLLRLFGFLMLFLFAAVHIYIAVYSHAAIRAFWRSQSTSTRVFADSSHRKIAIPDFRFWSQKRIEVYQASLIARVAGLLGVLRTSAINLEVPALEGTDDLTLSRAVGHVEGTAAPGETSNVGIAGHRAGFFRGLKDIHLGNMLDPQMGKGNFCDVVDETVIVSPEDVSVLVPRPKGTLTLVTCYPFHFVGSAPLRYVAHATITDSTDLTNSEQPSSLAEEHGGQNSH